jgi:hypothetical protein
VSVSGRGREGPGPGRDRPSGRKHPRDGDGHDNVRVYEPA